MKRAIYFAMIAAAGIGVAAFEVAAVDDCFFAADAATKPKIYATSFKDNAFCDSSNGKSAKALASEINELKRHGGPPTRFADEVAAER